MIMKLVEKNYNNGNKTVLQSKITNSNKTLYFARIVVQLPDL